MPIILALAAERLVSLKCEIHLPNDRDNADVQIVSK